MNDWISVRCCCKRRRVRVGTKAPGLLVTVYIVVLMGLSLDLRISSASTRIVGGYGRLIPHAGEKRCVMESTAELSGNWSDKLIASDIVLFVMFFFVLEFRHCYLCSSHSSPWWLKWILIMNEYGRCLDNGNVLRSSSCTCFILVYFVVLGTGLCNWWCSFLFQNLQSYIIICEIQFCGYLQITMNWIQKWVSY